MNQVKVPASYRAGFVALIGEPNAGKSTLLNALLGDKVSIVSDKPQTTRTRVTGILSKEDSQIVFVDAPGTLKSTSGINKFLQEEVADVVAKADVLCLLLASEQGEESAKELIGLARKSGKPWVVVVTKGDLMGGTRTPKYFSTLIEEKVPFVTVTTLRRPEEAVREVLERVVPLLPLAPAPLYDDELYTTQTVRQMAAESVREACFDHLRQEVPYGVAVRIAKFDESGPVVKIQAEIMVERNSHKGIVIGAGGLTLKAIGTQARKEIERVVGGKVFLELHVHVTENWTQNPKILKELGYVVPKE